MLHKTEGIVISTVNFKESSIVARIYTREFGILSYVINNVRTSKPRYHPSLFQPLTLVEMVTYYSQSKDLQRFSEIKAQPAGAHESAAKTCIKLFLSEFLDKIIRDEGVNHDLFDFIKSAINFLQHADSDYHNFHLYFLIKISGFMGVDMEESDYLSGVFISETDYNYIKQIAEGENPPIGRQDRMRLLNHLLTYYIQHNHIGVLKSSEILSEILD